MLLPPSGEAVAGPSVNPPRPTRRSILRDGGGCGGDGDGLCLPGRAATAGLRTGPLPAARPTPSWYDEVNKLGIFAVLAGARNFREAGDRAADLPPVLLEAAGTRRDPRTGELVPPTGSTLRRVTEDIDVDAADLLVCRWIADRTRHPDGHDDNDDADGRWGLAMDGKTVRRSGAGNPDANVKLFSAMLHDEAVVIAQLRVPDATTDVTQVEELLDPIDLAKATS